MYKSAKRSRHHDVDLQADIERIKTAITEAAFDVRSKAESVVHDTLNSARDRSISIRDNLGEYAHSKPLKVIGFSMLAGLALGFLMRK